MFLDVLYFLFIFVRIFFSTTSSTEYQFCLYIVVPFFWCVKTEELKMTFHQPIPFCLKERGGKEHVQKQLSEINNR